MPRLSVRKIHDLDNLAEVVKRRRAADDAVTEWVMECRQNGRSWREIAAVLGISHQGAQQRYGKNGQQTIGGK